MQMCMHASVPRPPVLVQKGASDPVLCKYPPYGSMDGNNNADGHHNGRGSDSCACVYCGDAMACDGGVCDCVAVMDDVRPALVVHTCIMLRADKTIHNPVYTNVLTHSKKKQQ